MNKTFKQLEMNPRVINLYDRTIRELYLRALKGLRQPFKVEFWDEDDEIFFMTGIRVNSNGPHWDRNYPQHRGASSLLAFASTQGWHAELTQT
jgi:hypothetical protein